MRNLILNRDLRKLALGATPVALAGLILGAAMHPTLIFGQEAGGPQMQAGVSGTRMEHIGSAAASWASYQGKLPDYVVGTDWTRPRADVGYREDAAYQAEAEADRGRDFVQDVEPREYAYAADERAAPAVDQRRWEDEPREAVRYPSQSGGAFNPSDLPPAPEPPVEPFEPAAG